MDILISANALKESIITERNYITPDNAHDIGMCNGLSLAHALVLIAPTVEAVPVVHGRWIPTYHTYYNRDGECKIADEWHCSECEIYSKGEWHYCPNCGAKMDLEE